MTHPCADHINTCDHCALCESGVCCAGLSDGQRAQLAAVIEAGQYSQGFQRAVAAEAERVVSLASLVRIEAERQMPESPRSARSLPGGVVAALPASSSIDARKEAVYVPVARQS